MSRKMKDSGIDWIGEIPEEWEVRRIKTISTCRENKLADNSGTDYFALENIVSWNGSYIHTDSIYDTTGAIICKTGDIAFGKLRPYLAKVFQIEHDRCCSSEFAVFGDFLGFSRYYFYIMLTNGFVNSVDLSTYGVKMPRANIDYIKNMFVPIPSYNEQQHISGYLDRQCTHIDNIIEKTKTSIEEYKKLKQAVITQAVTKGVRGDRPMKDSGIEWIGEIPEEWEVTRMKYCAELSPKCNLLSLHEKSIVEYLPMEYVKNRSYIHNTALYGSIPHSLTQFQNGDIIFAKVTPCFENGNIAIPSNMPSGIGFGSSELYVLRTIKILKNYLFYWIQNSLFVNEACATMTGTGGLKRVSSAFVCNSYLPYPSAAEQSEIAAYLDKKCAEIDAIINKKQKFITEMENYKKSLIFECVTGKREVSV